MNDDKMDNELIKHQIEVWKTIVGTQQHFNTLQVQLRNYALTVYAAIIALMGLFLKEHIIIEIHGHKLLLAGCACIAGIIIMFAFYFMDWGYLQLLKASVDQGKAVEKQLQYNILKVDLAQSITKASSGKRFLWIIPTSSTIRLNSFYALLMLSLLMLFIVLIAIPMPEKDAKSNKTDPIPATIPASEPSMK